MFLCSQESLLDFRMRNMWALSLLWAESSLLAQLSCYRNLEHPSTGAELLSLEPTYPHLSAGSQAHREAGPGPPEPLGQGGPCVCPFPASRQT